MCMTGVQDVKIGKVDAWKVFSVHEGKLQPTFKNARQNADGTPKEQLFYETNKKIRVLPEEATFFAFEQFGHACRLANDGNRQRSYCPDRGGDGQQSWNVNNNSLVILPVTLYEVVGAGKFHYPSEDIQCMDGYFPAFEAKEIEIHDSEEVRKDIALRIVKKFLKNQRLSFLQQLAFSQLLGVDLNS